jgi:3-hydroxyisobutyrate dehydrogenase
MTKQTIAVMGLGNMGAGMARNLLKKGFPVVVYNRTQQRSEAFAKDGARIATSPRQAAEQADVIVSMLPDDAVSRSAWLGAEGALAAAKKGAVLIESSTLSPVWVAELSAAATAHGCEFLDAPVTGSKVQAESGELLFLVGGEASTLDKVREPLAAMSRGVVHLGPTGSGARMKLVNNFLCGVQTAALAEAIAFIESSGLDRAKALEILLNGAPGSPMVKTLAPRMVAQDYRPFFGVALMSKDLAYAVAEAQQHGVTLKTGQAALERFRNAVADWGNQDLSAVVEPLRRK